MTRRPPGAGNSARRRSWWRRASPALLVAVLCLPLRTARAQERWSLSGEALAMSAPILPGVVLGGSIEGRRSIATPLFLSLRLGGGWASDSNETWDISQTHLFATVGVGASHTLGRARLSAGLHLGAMVISELDQRHQFQRLTEANIPNREQRALAVGPLTQLTLAAELELVERWFLRLSAGPQATWLKADGVGRIRGGVFTGVGVTHAF